MGLTRRTMFGGLLVLAAPAIIRTPGLLMPVKALVTPRKELIAITTAREINDRMRAKYGYEPIDRRDVHPASSGTAPITYRPQYRNSNGVFVDDWTA